MTLWDPAGTPGQVKASGKSVKATSLRPEPEPPEGSSTTLALPGSASKFLRSSSQKLCMRMVLPCRWVTSWLTSIAPRCTEKIPPTKIPNSASPSSTSIRLKALRREGEAG